MDKEILIERDDFYEEKTLKSINLLLEMKGFYLFDKTLTDILSILL